MFSLLWAAPVSSREARRRVRACIKDSLWLVEARALSAGASAEYMELAEEELALLSRLDLARRWKGFLPKP